MFDQSTPTQSGIWTINHAGFSRAPSGSAPSARLRSRVLSNIPPGSPTPTPPSCRLYDGVLLQEAITSEEVVWLQNALKDKEQRLARTVVD